MTLPHALAAAGGISAHRAHLLVVGVPTLAMVAIALAADVRSHLNRRGQHRRLVGNRTLVAAAAACSLLAMAIHVSVAPEHFHEDVLFGVFFTITAACQLGWAVLAFVQPRRHWMLAGCLGNAAIVALWAYTRFVSLPLGPSAGSREDIGTRDVLATCAELLLVVTTAWALGRSRRTSSTAHATTDVRLIKALGRLRSRVSQPDQFAGSIPAAATTAHRWPAARS